MGHDRRGARTLSDCDGLLHGPDQPVGLVPNVGVIDAAEAGCLPYEVDDAVGVEVHVGCED